MRRLPPLAVVPLAVALVLVLGTCDDQPTIPLPDSPSGEISDAFHGEAGNAHFLWLPPMVPQPESFSGAFDDDSDPVVTICELTDTGCTLLVHGSTGDEAVYTVSDGPGGVVVQVDPVEEQFLVTWHTDDFNTAVGPTYRVRVSLGATLLGLADLTLAATGKEVTKKNEITGDTDVIALKDGRTMPITFRIEEGAICADPTQPCTSATVQSGEEKTVTLTDDQGEVSVEVRFPSGWAATDENGDPVDALTLTIQKRPVVPTEDPDDPSCLLVVRIDDPETGEPENCVELRLDTDTEFDVQVDFVQTGDGLLPVLTFCPDEDVLALPEQERARYVMTSVEEDVADPAIQNRRTYEGVGGLDCTSAEIGFGGSSSEGLLALGTRLLGSVAALLLPEELWAIDVGFGGQLDACCTIFFFAIDKEAEVVSAPAVTEAPVGTDLGTVEVEVRSTHPEVQPLPGEELTFSFMRPELPVGTFDQPTVVTDANGIAAHNWTLGTAAGRNTLFIFGATRDTARLEVLGLGRVSLWKGDGDETDAVGQNHGVRVNPDANETTQVRPFDTGIVDQAFYFDGTGDVVSFPARNIRAAPHLTVATWVHLDPDGPADEIQRFVTLGEGERAVLRQNNPPDGGARQLHFYMNIDDEDDGFDEDGTDLHHINLDNALATGCWHHVAGTYDGATMRLYLDGNQVGSLPVSGEQWPNAGAVRLSHVADPGDGVPHNEALYGRLDEVEVHNVALTAQEIGAIWSSTPSPAGEAKCGEAPVGPELRFVQQPTRTQIGTAISPPVTVEVVDPADGARLTAFEGTLRMLVNTGPVHFFAGNQDFVDAPLVDGVATWPTLQLDVDGDYQLWAVPADGGGGTSATPAFSESFAVFTPALLFVQQPTRTQIGTAISPAVTVEVVDPADNTRLTDFGGSLRMLVNNGPVHFFAGNQDFVDAPLVDGVATWPTLQLDVDGDYQLWAVPTDDAGFPSATPAFSETFAVFTPALLFVQQPTDTPVGEAISPAVTVEVVDPADNTRLTDFGGSLRMLVNNGPVPFFAGNQDFVDAPLVDGVATWPTLQLDVDGDYQLWAVPADDGGFASATPAFSETFAVLPR